jgi:hypothetical protein
VARFRICEDLCSWIRLALTTTSVAKLFFGFDRRVDSREMPRQLRIQYEGAIYYMVRSRRPAGGDFSRQHGPQQVFRDARPSLRRNRLTSACLLFADQSFSTQRRLLACEALSGCSYSALSGDQLQAESVVRRMSKVKI